MGINLLEPMTHMTFDLLVEKSCMRLVPPPLLVPGCLIIMKHCYLLLLCSSMAGTWSLSLFGSSGSASTRGPAFSCCKYKILFLELDYQVVNSISGQKCSFPLRCMSGATKHNQLSTINIPSFHPPLAPYILQRKISKIKNKIVVVCILTFLAIKPTHRLFNRIGLHFWSPYTPFDSHIVIYRYDMCWMAYTSNITFLAFWTKIMHIYGILHLSW